MPQEKKPTPSINVIKTLNTIRRREGLPPLSEKHRPVRISKEAKEALFLKLIKEKYFTLLLEKVEVVSAHTQAHILKDFENIIADIKSGKRKLADFGIHEKPLD